MEEDLFLSDKSAVKIHVWVRKRSGTKQVTTIEGISEELNIKKILTYLKKKLSCGGSLQEDNIIQLTGDQRLKVRDIFILDKIVPSQEYIVLHGC